VHVAVRGTGARRRDERPACATLAWGPCLPATLYVRGREWTRRGRGVMLIEKACTFQLDCDERRGWGGARRPLVTSAAGDWIEAMTHVGGAVVPPAVSKSRVGESAKTRRSGTAGGRAERRRSAGGHHARAVRRDGERAQSPAVRACGELPCRVPRHDRTRVLGRGVRLCL
jgi:hypothetical protein